MSEDALLRLAERIERYDPKLSSDNRADEADLHDAVVMITGIGSLTHTFETTFARSLDAAMTLVPEGCAVSGAFKSGRSNVSVYPESGESKCWTSRAATPALALTASCLRAIAARDGA